MVRLSSVLHLRSTDALVPKLRVEVAKGKRAKGAVAWRGGLAGATRRGELAETTFARRRSWRDVTLARSTLLRFRRL